MAWISLRLAYSFLKDGDWGKLFGGAFAALTLAAAAAVSVENMGGKITPLTDPDYPMRR
jgi:hypothetical protein